MVKRHLSATGGETKKRIGSWTAGEVSSDAKEFSNKKTKKTSQTKYGPKALGTETIRTKKQTTKKGRKRENGSGST